MTIHIGGETRTDGGHGAVDFVLRERPVRCGEDQPKRQTASVIGQGRPAVDIEQLHRHQQGAGVLADGGVHVTRRAVDRDDDSEIGRASCRERVSLTV